MEEKKKQVKQKEKTDRIQEEKLMAVDRYVQLTHMKAWQETAGRRFLPAFSAAWKNVVNMHKNAIIKLCKS